MTHKVKKSEAVEFTMGIVGRTLEHLGVQMYKRRDVAVAELVANCWDAGATQVVISVPTAAAYDPGVSEICIRDNGVGMAQEQVQSEYLVIGRNRRRAGPDVINGRPIMGRKGIGKLAGFGIASRMEVATWRDGRCVTFELDIDKLKRDDNNVGQVKIAGTIGTPPVGIGAAGTRITLRNLKHVTPIDPERLNGSLARRFSRTVSGRMRIAINGQALHEPDLDLEFRNPEKGLLEEDVTAPEGSTAEVRYFYAFAKSPIRPVERRGFVIHVRGKTAQASPFFFGVEGTASGMNGAPYVTGEIEADFLDSIPGDEGDFISTDRQEIDWESERVEPFMQWGEKLSRRVLIELAEMKGRKMEDWLLAEQEMADRVNALDPESQKHLRATLRTLGRGESERQEARDLADKLVQAYEFKHFHDVIEDIDSVGDDPKELETLLKHLGRWQVLESRAILEIVRGRLGIIDKLESMLREDAPETAPRVGADNIHDLIARYPWLLNPEWQVLAEERTLTKQLQEWGVEELGTDNGRERFDFLALTDEARLVVVDIKRPGHVVDLEELQRLERYKDKLARATEKQLLMVMVCSGRLNVDSGTERTWQTRPDGQILPWPRVLERAKSQYNHYRAVLERNVADPAFTRKEEEVAQTRRVIGSGTAYRGDERKDGLGPQDVRYNEEGS